MKNEEVVKEIIEEVEEEIVRVAYCISDKNKHLYYVGVV